jgi:AmmeMemoRadiSam system protein A
MLELKAFGSDLPGIARLAIANFLQDNARLDLGRPGAPRAPVFVTLRSLDGALRGCIGSLVAMEPDVAAETARSAVLAATRDPRFPPVRSDELGKLQIEVSVLLPDEPVTNFEELDPQRYGVVVRDERGRQGLLLPEVPGVDTAELQVQIARRKAGIEPDASVTLRRFEVVKFSE